MAGARIGSLLVVTEDSGAHGHATVVEVLKRMLRPLVPDYQTQRVGFEPSNPDAQRAVRGPRWKSTEPRRASSSAGAAFSCSRLSTASRRGSIKTPWSRSASATITTAGATPTASKRGRRTAPRSTTSWRRRRRPASPRRTTSRSQELASPHRPRETPPAPTRGAPRRWRRAPSWSASSMLPLGASPTRRSTAKAGASRYASVAQQTCCATPPVAHVAGAGRHPDPTPWPPRWRSQATRRDPTASSTRPPGTPEATRRRPR